MDRKKIALAAVAAVLVLGMTVGLLSSEADAEDLKALSDAPSGASPIEKTITTDSGNGTAMIFTNGTITVGEDIVATQAWSVYNNGDGTGGSWVATTSEQANSGVSNVCESVTITTVVENGIYKTTVEVTDMKVDTMYLGLEFKIASSSAESISQFMHYKLIKEEASAGTITFTGQNPLAVQQKVAVSIDYSALVGEVQLGDDARWYAKGLPEGLQMTSKGTLHGITEDTAKDHSVTVYVDTASGKKYQASLTVRVSEAAAVPTAEVSSITGFDKDLGDVNIGGPSTVERFLLYTGSTLQFSISVSNMQSNQSVVVTWADAAEDADITLNSGTASGNYTVTPTGTGEYFVKVKFVDSTKDVTIEEYVLSVLVVEKIKDVQAGISFNLNTTKVS